MAAITAGIEYGREKLNFLAGTIIVTAFVAINAFLGSYQHQYELVIRYGQTHWVAGLYPLSVDFLIVSATLVTWYAAQKGWKRPIWVWFVLFGSIVASALANLAADGRARQWFIGPSISVWPALSFLAAYEMTIWMVRNHRGISDTPDNINTDASVEHHDASTSDDNHETQPNTKADSPAFKCGHTVPAGLSPGSLAKCPDCGKLDKVPGSGVK